MKENLRTTTKLKNNAVGRLQDYTGRYFSLILVNIVTIQRWWKGVLQREFFKTVVSKALKKDKEEA